MSLVDYGFYSDEEGDVASSPSGSLAYNPRPLRPPPESSPHNADNSLSDSEATYNSRASTPAPTAASSRAVDPVKSDCSPSERKDDGGSAGPPPAPPASAAASAPCDSGQGEAPEAEAAESEEQRKALEEERAAVQELMSRVPKGTPPQELLATIERLQHLKRRGITVNGNINTSLDFKNPYLLELAYPVPRVSQKIMKVFDIDPYCSNYPPGFFTDIRGAPPFEVEDNAPFYVYVAKRQERRRQRREKQREMKEALAAPPPPAAVSTPSKSQQHSNSAPSSSNIPMPLNAASHVNVAVTQAATATAVASVGVAAATTRAACRSNKEELPLHQQLRLQ
ncbi:hypothetical protein ACSSS7_002160 [Eimeria intestinalis]